MSGRRKLRRKAPPEVVTIAAASACSDCGGKATAKWRAGGWLVTHHHYRDCPAYRGLTAGLHADAEKAVRVAAERTGASFHYEPAGDRDGVVVTGPGGIVTTGS